MSGDGSMPVVSRMIGSVLLPRRPAAGDRQHHGADADNEHGYNGLRRHDGRPRHGAACEADLSHDAIVVTARLAATADGRN